MRSCKVVIAGVLVVLLAGLAARAEVNVVIERNEQARAVSQSPSSARYRITIDYTAAPELKGWVEKKLQPTLDKWYPMIIKALPSENFKPPARVAIAITEDYRGVAATAGNRVVCSAGLVQEELQRRGRRGGGPRTGTRRAAVRAHPGRAAQSGLAGGGSGGLYPLVQVRADADGDAAQEPRTRPSIPTAIASRRGS